MLKRLKSVSMLLFLMGASTGAAYAVANPGVTDVKITQQSGTCTGVVKDATGETVIGASVVVKGTTNGTCLLYTSGFGTGPFHHFINLSDSPSLKLLPILGQTEAAIKKAFLYGAAQKCVIT